MSQAQVKSRCDIKYHGKKGNLCSNPTLCRNGVTLQFWLGSVCKNVQSHD